MTKYMYDKWQREQEKSIRDYAVFGQMSGLLFLLIGYSQWLKTYRILFSVLLEIVMIFGIYLTISGLVVPDSISWLYKVFHFVGNKIGEIIFIILLIIIYIVLIIPVGVFLKKRNASYQYFSWDDNYPGEELTGFLPWHPAKTREQKSMLGIVMNLLSILIGNGQYFILPVVVLLIAIGIILFFVSSSVMAPFIYTLF